MTPIDLPLAGILSLQPKRAQLRGRTFHALLVRSACAKQTVFCVATRAARERLLELVVAASLRVKHQAEMADALRFQNRLLKEALVRVKEKGGTLSASDSDLCEENARLKTVSESWLSSSRIVWSFQLLEFTERRLVAAQTRVDGYEDPDREKSTVVSLVDEKDAAALSRCCKRPDVLDVPRRIASSSTKPRSLLDIFTQSAAETQMADEILSMKRDWLEEEMQRFDSTDNQLE